MKTIILFLLLSIQAFAGDFIIGKKTNLRFDNVIQDIQGLIDSYHLDVDIPKSDMDYLEIDYDINGDLYLFIVLDELTSDEEYKTIRKDFGPNQPYIYVNHTNPERAVPQSIYSTSLNFRLHFPNYDVVPFGSDCYYRTTFIEQEDLERIPDSQFIYHESMFYFKKWNNNIHYIHGEYGDIRFRNTGKNCLTDSESVIQSKHETQTSQNPVR